MKVIHSQQVKKPAEETPKDPQKIKAHFDEKTGEIWTEDDVFYGYGKLVDGKIVVTSTRG